MPDASTVAVFMLAAGLLLIVPGPAVLYIVARGIDQGRRAALASMLGIEIASLFHITAATLGLSALLVSSATAFNVVRYAGAAYLIFLGVRTLLSRGDVRRSTGTAPASLRRVFAQGVVVNLLNPKTALFFFAFLPQFVDPARGSVAGQTLFLGGLFVALAVCSDGSYALLSGSLGGWLKGHLGFLRAQRYFAGSVYLALGVATALTGSRKK
ncbi:MAG TPA: LysE family translocator [Thermomicrobiales bacterium]|jgi:threonine/homoserine/homoserine lactone efflux protein